VYIERNVNVFEVNMEKGKKSIMQWLLLAAAGVSVCAFTKAQTRPKIYIISDSTVCNYGASDYPWAGWGQELQLFFDTAKVTVDNRSIGGRSSRKFYEEGRWTSVAGLLKTGDYVFIQFGHNDRDYTKEDRYTDTTDFKKYLKIYVDESRAKGAIPVFISPMNMNTWNGTALREVFCEAANDYRGVMMRLAQTLDVPFIDLEKKSAAFMKSAGQEYCTYFHFMGLRAGEYPNFPDGKSDGTHFQEMGALVNARMVVEGVSELTSRSEMKILADARTSLFELTVSTNKPDAGLVTLSGEFPAGAPVTLKTIPKTGEMFQGWFDENGKSVATSERYTFTMKNGNAAFSARFKGGSTPVVRGAHDVSGLKAADVQRFVFNAAEHRLEIVTSLLIDDVSVVDANGRVVRHVRPEGCRTAVVFDRGVCGAFVVNVKTDGGVVNRRVVIF